ncbi:MAG: DNA repair protein RecN [Defluviitaleaceae bacterium]|nr:DNA repair protein RecN [Defluviitaleaceae bacterium]
MLEVLHIKNAALIEEAEIHFDSGLNIISGETGAGKSMLVGAINMLFGERSGSDFIRQGADRAYVEGFFRLSNNMVLLFSDMGINAEENTLLISRSIGTDGKSNCRVNGRVVTVGMLKEVAAYLVDIHSQHQTRSLMNPQRHIELLDVFCDEIMTDVKKQLRIHIDDYKDIIKKIDEITGDEKDRDKAVEFLRFQYDELTNANIKEDEEETLSARRQTLIGYERIIKNSTSALLALSDIESGGAIDKIYRASTNIADLSKSDSNAEPMLENIKTISAMTDDLIRELRRYMDGLTSSPEELDDIEARLTLIGTLKRKYGGSVQSILKYYSDIANRLDSFANEEESLKKLAIDKKDCLQKVIELCDKLTAERKNAAAVIKGQMENHLSELGMKNAKFDILIERKKTFSSNGCDNVEFMISANIGEPLKPLAKIASGGEMSRIMLALKTILAYADNTPTFIFDEIDTGISGRTAQQVAEKLTLISGSHQIICITHLPQIAAMADRHYLIEKSGDDTKTITNIAELNDNESVEELARLLGGVEITDATLTAAHEMREMAKNRKGSS